MVHLRLPRKIPQHKAITLLTELPWHETFFEALERGTNIQDLASYAC